MKTGIAWFLVKLMASPAGTVAAALTSRYPAAWRRFILSPVLPPLRPAGVERLREMMASTPDPARLMYSMALAHLENANGISDAQALACLRTAEFLGFPGQERLALYQAVLAARRGDHAGAIALRARLDPAGMTADEKVLLDAAIARATPAMADDNDRRGGTVVLLGERAVCRSHCHSDGRMVWVSPRGNGLTFAWLAATDTEFDVTIGDDTSLERARAAGVRFLERITV